MSANISKTEAIHLLRSNYPDRRGRICNPDIISVIWNGNIIQVKNSLLLIIVCLCSFFSNAQHENFDPGRYILTPYNDDQELPMACAYFREQVEKDFNVRLHFSCGDTGLLKDTAYKNSIGRYITVSMEKLDSDPHAYIASWVKAGAGCRIAKDKLWLAFARQNIGFIYEERLNRPDTAVGFINASLELWHEINDTLQIANLYKYRAYLYGITGRIADGMKDIDTALMLYTAKKNEPGIMVTLNNLAGIYAAAGKPDSALNYYRKVLVFWEKNEVAERIFNINLHILSLLDNPDDAAVYLNKNDQILESEVVIGLASREKYALLRKKFIRD